MTAKHQCCAKLCKEQAIMRVAARRDHGEFHGHLCHDHYLAFESFFPAKWTTAALLVSTAALLVSITTEMLGEKT